MTDSKATPLPPEQRLFPIQVGWWRSCESAKVPEVVYMAAYEVYSHVFGPQQALIDLEDRNCRGGFGISELTAFLYARAFPKDEWRRRVDEAFKGAKLP